MEPRIQYAKPKDGVSIAYSTVGTGRPLVYTTPALFSHLHLEWQLPAYRTWYEQLAERWTLIRFDRRGVGLSEREIGEPSLETFQADVGAVVDALGLKRFALFGNFRSAPNAIAYAARYPERVSRLVLMGAYAGSADTGAAPDVVTAFTALMRDDWDMAVRAFGSIMFPSGPVDAQRWLSTLIRNSVSGEVAARYTAVAYEFDVTELVPLVRTPTLIINYRKAQTVPLAAGRAVAALLPNASLVAVDGDAEHYYQGHQQWIDTVLKFLDEGRGEKGEAQPSATSALVTILFTDMQSSTAFTQRLGDAKAQEVRRAHNEIVRAALSANGGSEIKHTGDGIMASFPSTSGALECAIAIQRGVAAHVEEHPDSPLGVYIGLNAGEPITEDDPGGRVDLFGTSVDLAARICDHAEPGQIIASDVVRQLAAGKDFLFADLGETELRGFEDPVRLYEVRWREEG